jgi:energy-coupling factor transport system substrate-specific component
MSSQPRPVAVPRRTAATLTMATVVGVVAFTWPFVVAPGRIGISVLAPFLFGALLLVVLAVVFAEIADGGIDSKAIAMLGVLSAVEAAIRPLGAGTAGVETVFLVLVLAGRVFGAGFGFVLGCTSLFASALVTGGVGPWVPYQMFGCAWIAMVAGWLPPMRGRFEVLMLAAYGAVSGYVFGFLLDLSGWPSSIGAGDVHSAISYVPGAAFGVQWRRFLLYETATSLGWDTGRAVTNFVLILLAGPVLLAALRRAARRAVFTAAASFPVRSPEPERGARAVCGAGLAPQPHGDGGCEPVPTATRKSAADRSEDTR